MANDVLKRKLISEFGEIYNNLLILILSQQPESFFHENFDEMENLQGFRTVSVLVHRDIQYVVKFDFKITLQ